MRRPLLLVVSLVFLVLLGLAGPAVRPVHASASRLLFSQSCSNGKADVTFNWLGGDPSASQQWVDLSLSDNGWQAGTYLSAGPLGGRATSYTWTGLTPDTTHYVRINQQLPGGVWDPSQTFQVSTACGANLANPDATITITGFADHLGAGTGNAAPADAVPSGGTLKSCNPAAVYAFFRITNLSADSDFTYQWTTSGTTHPLEAMGFRTGSNNYFVRQGGADGGFPTGPYAFRLSSGPLTALGSFSLAC